MLSLTFGQSNKIFVTLNEKKTLADGYYLFVFTNIITRDVVNKIYAFSSDESSFKGRYNKFTITTSTAFANQQTGTWRYEVYEQASSSNTNISGLTEVEKGLMDLNPATGFAFEEYSGVTSFKTYGG